MTTVTWRIESLMVENNVNGLENVVAQITWICEVVDGDFKTHTAGFVPLEVDLSVPFIPYESLAEGKVWDWVEARIDKTAIEESLVSSIASQKLPKYKYLTTPWKSVPFRQNFFTVQNSEALSAFIVSNVTYNGSVFCAVTKLGSTQVATSSDGKTWVINSCPELGQFFYGIDTVFWTGKVFCAVACDSGQVATSTDGLSWTIGNTIAKGLSKVVWNGVKACACERPTGRVHLSGDGITWTSTYTVPSTVRVAAPTCATSTGFILTTRECNLIISNDHGATWNIVNSLAKTPFATNNTIVDIIFAQGMICVLGRNLGSFAVSADNGVTWKCYSNAPPIFSLPALAAFDDKIYFLTKDKVYASIDGATWKNNTPRGFSGKMNCLADDGKTLVMLGESSGVATASIG